MIIDPQPPETPRRRWPFLVGWCCAAITIVLALFLTHDPFPHQALVTLSTSHVPPTFASVSPSISVEQVSIAETLRRSGVAARENARAGRNVYLVNTDTWIAVGPNDNPLIPPGSQTTKLR